MNPNPITIPDIVQAYTRLKIRQYLDSLHSTTFGKVFYIHNNTDAEDWIMELLSGLGAEIKGIYGGEIKGVYDGEGSNHGES